MRRILLFAIFTLNILFAKETLYLHMPSPLPSKNADTSYGKELIRLIEESKESIDFAIYGLRGQEDILDALKNAKNRGVKIRGVVDSDTKGNNYYGDTHILYREFDIKSDGKSYIMHHKFFIFDEKKIWSGSSNISDTGTGGYNSNSVIVIKDKLVASIYKREFEEMYSGKFGKKKTNRGAKNIKTTDSTLSIYFSPQSRTFENGIRDLVRDAREYIYIPIFYLTHKDLANELIAAHKRGVEIKIILDATAARNRYSIHKRVRESGIEVKVENFGGKMHNKSMIIDDRFFIAGSMNFTAAGDEKNDENSIIINNPKLTMQYKDYFLALWNLIPNRYLYIDPSAESLESGNSCFDGIDNDFDRRVDEKDSGCK